MIEIRQTGVYAKWFDGLRDRAAQERVNHRGNTVVILLAGGDKRTQDRDIKSAMDLAQSV